MYEVRTQGGFTVGTDYASARIITVPPRDVIRDYFIKINTLSWQDTDIISFAHAAIVGIANVFQTRGKFLLGDQVNQSRKIYNVLNLI